MTKTTLQKLKAAYAALGKAIAALEVVEESPERYQIGFCTICNQPIYSDQKIRRERHFECYHALYDSHVKTGEATLEELEAAGLIGPKRKPGPAPKTESTSDTIARTNAALRRHRQQQERNVKRDAGD